MLFVFDVEDSPAGFLFVERACFAQFPRLRRMGIEHRPDAFFGFVVQVAWDAFEADVDADDFGGIVGRELA